MMSSASVIKGKVMRPVVLYLILILLNGGMLLAQTETTDANESTVEVSLDAFTLRVAEKLPEMKQSRLDELARKNEIEKTRAVDDLTIEAELKYQQTQEQLRYSGSGEYPYELDTDDMRPYDADVDIRTKLRGPVLESSATRAFSSTGTRLQVGTEFSRAESVLDLQSTNTIDLGTMGAPLDSFTMPNDIDLNGSEHLYRPVVYAGVVQPLLQNAFGILDRVPGKEAALLLKVEELKQQDYRRSLLSYYRKLYMDWLVYDRAIGLLADSIQSTRAMVANVQGRYRSGMSDADDMHRSTAALLMQQDQMKSYELTRRLTVLELQPFMNQNEAPLAGEFETMVADAGTVSFHSVPFEETEKGAMFRISFRRLALLREAATNRGKPQLNLTAQARMQNLDRDLSDSITGLADGEQTMDYSVGFHFIHPLGNHEGRAILRQARISEEQLRVEREITERNYLQGLEKIRLSAESLTERIALKEQHVAALRARLAVEYRKYRVARISLNTITDTRTTLSQEEMALLFMKRKLIDLWFDYRDLTR